MTLTYGTIDDERHIEQPTSAPVTSRPSTSARHIEQPTSAPVTSRPSTSDSDRFSEQDTENATQHAITSNDDDPSVIEEDPEAIVARKKARMKKIFIGLILLGIVIYIIVDSTTNRYVAQGIQTFLRWFEENPVAGLFAFMGVYFLATVLFVPGSILTLGAGFVFANAFGLGWGVLLATVAVFCGAVAGDLTAFLLGRYLLRGWVMGWTDKYKLFQAIDKALEKNGFRIMSLLRLSPVIPFNAINYIAGVTSISFSAYAWANLFIIPGTILFCFLGATAGSLADSGASGDSGIITIVTIVVGIVFGVLAIVVVSFYAKKELNKILEEQNEQDEDSSTGPEGGDEGDIEAGTAEEAKDGESPGNLVNQRSESQSIAAGSSSLSFVEEVVS